MSISQLQNNWTVTLVGKPKLRALLPIMQACCRKDETDSNKDFISICSEVPGSNFLSNYQMSIDTVQQLALGFSSRTLPKPVFTKEKPKL